MKHNPSAQVKITTDEFYPVLGFTNLNAYGQGPIKVPKSLVAKFKNNMREFHRLQKQIKNIAEKQGVYLD